MVALPVPDEPLWQEAQTFVVGEDALKVPAPPGKAETVGTCNCIPKITRTARMPENTRSTRERDRFKFYPLTNFLLRSARDGGPVTSFGNPTFGRKPRRLGIRASATASAKLPA